MKAYTPGRAAQKSRPNRESLSKRLGRVARQIKVRDGHACVYCRATAASSEHPLHLDHLVPRDCGGQDRASNLVLACHRCNRAKHALSLAAWQARAAELGVAFEAADIVAQAARELPEV